MTPLSSATVPRLSPWQSPVPYLFGGLAAIFALIAFALLILACSYLKLSRNLHADGDLEGGSSDIKHDNNNNNKVPDVFEEKCFVIMAGEVKPTFLATPSSSRTSSFGSNSCRSSSTATSAEDASTRVMEEDESNDYVQVSTNGSHVSA